MKEHRKIAGVFESHIGIKEADSRLLAAVVVYQGQFANKNEDHVKFFGGHLAGVKDPKFTPTDRERWFSEVLGYHKPHEFVDEVLIDSDLKALKWENWHPSFDPKSPIDNVILPPTMKVAGDVFNLSAVWLTQLFLTSRKLNQKQREMGAIATLKMLQAKFLTSLLNAYFVYPTTAEISELTYNNLSKKFLLRTAGSWDNLLQIRAEDIIHEESIHHKTFFEMEDDRIIYALSDIQGRIRSICINYYGVFVETHKNQKRIVTNSFLVEHDGEVMLKDKVKSKAEYGQYVISVMGDENSFIRSELTSIIQRLMPNMPESIFIESLRWLSRNQRSGHHGERISNFVNETLIFYFDYVSRNKSALRSKNDVPGVLMLMKGAYTSSRSTEKNLLALRSSTEKMVHEATGNSNHNVLSSVRTGMLLYIVLRAITKRHYTNSSS